MPAETFGRDGEPLPMCWVCAHLVTDHEADVTPDNFVEVTRMCTCPRERVFPNRTHPPSAAIVVGEFVHKQVEADLHAAPRSFRVPARERQAQARAAAARTRPRAADRALLVDAAISVASRTRTSGER